MNLSQLTSLVKSIWTNASNMTAEKIKDLDDLVVQYVGHKKIIDTSVSPLTAAGDNYGGILLKVVVTLKNEESDTEELNAVAKLIPRNQFMQCVLNVQETCKKEIAFYNKIVPTLNEFRKECGVDELDIFSKFYGARINLNGTDIVDNDSVILLENLMQSGYKIVDRLKGFDLETTKIIIKNLAVFHATPLALKLLNPGTFDDQIKPYLTDRFPQGGVTPAIVRMVILDFLQSCEECQSLLPQLKEILERPRVEKSEERKEPWLTIGHGDMWVNNIMVKFDEETPIGSKFVDFQNFSYRSPAVDLFLFIWTSVQNSVLEDHLDDLLKIYHECFVEQLQQLKCDVTSFSHDSLLEEMKIAAKYGIPHALFMIPFVVFCKRGGFSVDQDSSSPPKLGTKEDVTPEATQKVTFMLRKCNERGWLY